MKCKNLLLVFLFLSIFLSACSYKSQNYSYNNLTSEQRINEFYELLSSHAVPSEDIESLINFIRVYSKGSYAEKNLQGDWKNAAITERLYDYVKAINFYGNSPFEDLNCRGAAFLIFNSFLNTPDFSMKDIAPEEASPISSLKKGQSYYACYEVLFATFDSEQSVADAIKSYWKNQNIEFEGSDIHLVSLWGKKNDEITNLHCGVLLENESNTYFFEKVDPMMPYQISIFDSTEDMKAYLLNRTEEFEDMTVFVDDEPI